MRGLILSLICIFFALPAFSGEAVSACTALLNPTSPNEVTAEQLKNLQQLQFAELKDRMWNKGSVHVEEKEILVEGKKAYQLMRKFHNRLGGFNNRSHRIHMTLSFDYESSQVIIDPSDDKKLIKVHAFNAIVNDELTAYALLSERRIKSQNTFGELVIRLVDNNKGQITTFDLPLHFSSNSPYEALDRELNTSDQGLNHLYNSELRFVNPPVHIRASGVKASIKNSSMSDDIKDVVSFTIYAAK